MNFATRPKPQPAGVCPADNNPHRWGRQPNLVSLRSLGSITIWQCNNCTALYIEQSNPQDEESPIVTIIPDPINKE